MTEKMGINSTIIRVIFGGFSRQIPHIFAGLPFSKYPIQFNTDFIAIVCSDPGSLVAAG